MTCISQNWDLPPQCQHLLQCFAQDPPIGRNYCLCDLAVVHRTESLSGCCLSHIAEHNNKRWLEGWSVSGCVCSPNGGRMTSFLNWNCGWARKKRPLPCVGLWLDFRQTTAIYVIVVMRVYSVGVVQWMPACLWGSWGNLPPCLLLALNRQWHNPMLAKLYVFLKRKTRPLSTTK